jgi:hypothetical protein
MGWLITVSGPCHGIAGSLLYNVPTRFDRYGLWVGSGNNLLNILDVVDTLEAQISTVRASPPVLGM